MVPVRLMAEAYLGLFELTLRVPKEAQLPVEVNRFESLIDQEFLHSRIPSKEVSKVYVCGPPAMILAQEVQLAEAGVPDTQVSHEFFAA